MPDEVREHLTRDQRPFLHPESLQILQIHFTLLLLFSSPHSFSTGFRSEGWNGHSRSLVLCPVTHFCVVFKVCFWIIVQLEDPNIQKTFEVPVVSDNWICWRLFFGESIFFLDFFLETLPNNMWWCRGCLINFVKVFWLRNSTFFCNSPAVVLGESLATQTLLLTVH